MHVASSPGPVDVRSELACMCIIMWSFGVNLHNELF